MQCRKTVMHTKKSINQIIISHNGLGKSMIFFQWRFNSNKNKLNPSKMSNKKIKTGSQHHQRASVKAVRCYRPALRMSHIQPWLREVLLRTWRKENSHYTQWACTVSIAPLEGHLAVSCKPEFILVMPVLQLSSNKLKTYLPRNMPMSV